MIREMKHEDLEEVMRIWLESNVKAHNFISKEYWESQCEDVGKAISEAEVYVYDDNGIQGFIGMVETYMAGIFVSPKNQSQGMGKDLLNFVKEKKDKIYLSVYKKNEKAINFYLKHDFSIMSEGIDEENHEAEYVMKWIKK